MSSVQPNSDSKNDNTKEKENILSKQDLKPGEYEPFNTKDKKSLSFSLPDSVYSTAMIIPLAVPTDHFKKFDTAIWGVWLIATQYLSLIVNYLAQFGLIFYIKKIIQDPAGNGWCYRTNPLLVFSVSLFTLNVLKDLVETLNMTVWLLLFDTVKTHNNLRIKDGTDSKGKPIQTIVSGFPCVYKVFVFLFILVPKCLIAIMLWLDGFKYLFQSSTEEAVIAHTLSLTYIIKVDDFFYNFLAPKPVKHVFEDLPPVSKETGGKTFYLNLFVTPLAKCIIGLVGIYLNFNVFGWSICKCFYPKPAGTIICEHVNGTDFFFG